MNRQSLGWCIALGVFSVACGSSPHDASDAGTRHSRDPSVAGSAHGDASIPAASDERVGGFNIQLVAPTGGTPGATTVLGKVFDGPAAEAVLWNVTADEGGCKLLKPRVPFCDPACTGAVCVEDDVCRKNPVSRNLGKVTVTGLKSESGAGELTIDPIQNTYQVPANVKLSYPAFAESDTIRVRAAGADLPAFMLEGKGIAPLELTDGGSYTLKNDEVFMLAWTPRGAAGSSRIQVKLDISHHGGTKGKIECDVEDNGALEINASLISQLLALGVAGFPSVIVTRSNLSSTSISTGRVELEIYMYAEHAVDVPGLVSCASDDQCPSGQTCKGDSTCK